MFQQSYKQKNPWHFGQGSHHMLMKELHLLFNFFYNTQLTRGKSL
jgi:hypothetical protein